MPIVEKSNKTISNKIRYKNNWFNPLFHIIRDIEISRPKVNKIFCYGSKSSAKTLTIAQYLAIKGMAGLSSIAYRKESARINDTIKKSFKEAIKYTRLTNGYTQMDKQFRSIYKGEIVLRGLDSESKVKGLEGYSYLLFDELDHFTQEEFTEADLSFRGQVAKIAFFTWNPVSERIWIKAYLDSIEWHSTEYELPSAASFIKISSCGTMILIKTDYNDNFWTVGSPCGTYGYRDESLLQKYESLKTLNYAKYRVVALGEWGVTEVQSPAVSTFDTTIHVGKPEYDPRFPLIFSVDFNTNPLACTVWQHYKIESTHYIRCLREIGLENKKTSDLIDFIQTSYTPMELSRCYFTGDATGKIERTENLSNWMQIEKAFRLGSRLHLPSSNPHVLSSLAHCDFIFHRHKNILIDETCHRLIYELQYTEKDDSGLVKKDRNKLEQRADFLDTMRYYFNYYFFIQKNIVNNPQYFNI